MGWGERRDRGADVMLQDSGGLPWPGFFGDDGGMTYDTRDSRCSHGSVCYAVDPVASVRVGRLTYTVHPTECEASNPEWMVCVVPDGRENPDVVDTSKSYVHAMLIIMGAVASV